MREDGGASAQLWDQAGGLAAGEHSENVVHDLIAGILQRVVRVTAEVRRGAEVFQRKEILVAARLGRLNDEGVAGGGLELAAHERVVEILLVHDATAGGVD